MSTERQATILAVIRASQMDTGVPPIWREIQRRYKFASQTTVVRHSQALTQEELIQQTADRSWGVEPSTGTTMISPPPICGEVPAGVPAMQEEQPMKVIAATPAFLGVRHPDRITAGAYACAETP